ncbi:MAG TPA: tetratricopeptide repeat protein [Thermoanaerobaculia bacterium]|nr:tetratricopeptide repeat protein [Thermoanaerobaculia bacterium]
MRPRFVAAVLLFACVEAAWGADEVLKSASRLLDQGKTGEAEALLLSVVEKEPRSVRAYLLLGDAYRRDRRFSKARAAYEQALRLAPDDREAQDSLAGLARSRGLSLFGAGGDWEADSSGVKGWQAEAFHGGIDWLDPYIGASYSDKFFYNRRSYYGRFYAFYSPSGYVRVSGGVRIYDYPVATNPFPDANTYQRVPGAEIEVADDLSRVLRGSFSYGYFRPNFFFAPQTHASNHKFSGELAYRTRWDPLRLRLMGAFLRDPDPDRTIVDRTARRVTQLGYGTQFLLGGGAALSLSRFSGELLVLPNRDLDRTTNFSILARASVSLSSRVSLAGDYTFDHYSNQSPFAGQTAHLWVGTVHWSATPKIELSVGGKVVRRPVRNDSGLFATILVRP